MQREKMSNIQEFKEAHKRFTEALNYIIKNEMKLKQDKIHWERIKSNFYNKFEKVLDEKWQALPEAEKDRLAPLYLHYKAQQDEAVKQVIQVFNAKITKVSREK